MIEDNYVEARIKNGVCIYVWGDEQEGSEGFARECRDEMLYQFKKEPGTKLGLHLGDSFDWLRPTMRARVDGQLIHDPSARAQVSNMVRRAQDDALKDLTPFEGRMIGCHEGHHSWRYEDGTSTDQRLASALRTRYLGWIAATQLRLTVGEKGKKPGGGSFGLTLLSTHGAGNSTAIGSDAKKIQDLAMGTWADLYFRGHSCKAMVTPGLERRIIRSSRTPGVKKQVPWFINAPGMSKSYTNGWQSTYAERAGYTPQPIGWIVVRIGLSSSWAGSEANGVNRLRPDGGKRQPPTTLRIEATPVVFSEHGAGNE